MTIALTARHSGDAVSAALARLARQRPDLQVLDVADLAADAHLAFGSDGCASLQLHADHMALLTDGQPLVNRGFLSAEGLTGLGHSVVLLQTEVEERLRQVVDAAPAATARPGMYSLCGDYLPLFLQWQRAQALALQHRLALTTPRYDYAFGSLPPDVSGFSAPIYSHPFELRRWKPNAPPATFWHGFAIDRPAGVPVVAVVLGARVLVPASLSPALRALVDQASPLLAQAFGSQFGELLYFVDEATQACCFAAFSHVVRHPLDADALDEAVAQTVDALPAGSRH